MTVSGPRDPHPNSNQIAVKGCDGSVETYACATVAYELTFAPESSCFSDGAHAPPGIYRIELLGLNAQSSATLFMVGTFNWTGELHVLIRVALGENVAICFLQDQVNTFMETFTGFSFAKFAGTAVSIVPGTGAYSGLNLLTPLEN